ncbi:MAG: HNH endonuclease [Aridibacter sp.]
MNPYYSEVSLRADERCEYCQAPEAISNFLFEVEHIIPKFHGGSDDLENLALACRSCNVFKSNFLNGIDDSGFETERLFNPRIDNWEGHFEISGETLEIIGMTGIGRGTINRLRFNNKVQLRARRIWFELGSLKRN